MPRSRLETQLGQTTVGAFLHAGRIPRSWYFVRVLPHPQVFDIFLAAKHELHLGIKAFDAGSSVLFPTVETLMGRLIRARQENRLERMLQQLAAPRLLILDESGDLPRLREEASLFFRLLVRRYERGSLIVTSNNGFADWGDVFNDQILATAILDRLRHHATTLNTRARATGCARKRRPGSWAAESCR